MAVVSDIRELYACFRDYPLPIKSLYDLTPILAEILSLFYIEISEELTEQPSPHDIHDFFFNVLDMLFEHDCDHDKLFDPLLPLEDSNEYFEHVIAVTTNSLFVVIPAPVATATSLPPTRRFMGPPHNQN